MARDHGTAAYDLGQYNEVLVAITRALPNALAGTDPKITIAALGQKGEALGKRLNDAICSVISDGARTVAVAAHVPRPPTYPADGEVFELTLDGDATDPMAMVKGDGYNPRDWEFEGQRVTGKHTRRFKLVRLGYCQNLDTVRQRLVKHGRRPEGQWREAFRAAYPYPDGKGPIGAADPSWVYPDGRAVFPYVRSDGRSDFYWAARDQDEHWRWLVEEVSPVTKA